MYSSHELENADVVTVRAIDTHTAGEPTRIVLDGQKWLAGHTAAERRLDLLENKDWLRRSLMWEPRGHADMFGAILVPASSPDAHFGAVFMEHDGCPTMCVHGSIGLVTAVVTHSLVPGLETATEVGIETPSGVVRAQIRRTAEGDLRDVTITQAPARVVAEVEVLHKGRRAEVHVVGGDSWVILVRDALLGVDVASCGRDELRAIALTIRADVIPQLERLLGSNPQVTRFGIDQLAGSPVVIFGVSAREDCSLRTFVMFGDGAIDRSPCGTASGNLVAHLVAANELAASTWVGIEGSSGDRFWARASAASPDAAWFTPQITGSAWVTGTHEFHLAANDPFRHGFELT